MMQSTMQHNQTYNPLGTSSSSVQFNSNDDDGTASNFSFRNNTNDSRRPHGSSNGTNEFLLNTNTNYDDEYDDTTTTTNTNNNEFSYGNTNGMNHNPGGGGRDGGGGNLVRSISQSFQQSLADMMEIIITTNDNDPTTYYDYLDSTGKLYGRILTILVSSRTIVTKLLLPLSIATTIACVPFAWFYGSSYQLLHPAVALLFAMYIMMIGRTAMIYGIAQLYYTASAVGNNGSTIQQTTQQPWYYYIQYHSLQSSILYPLFQSCLVVGIPIIILLEGIEYIDTNYIYYHYDRTYYRWYHFTFWLSNLFIVISYSALIYGVVAIAKVALVVPFATLEPYSTTHPLYGSYTLSSGSSSSMAAAVSVPPSPPQQRILLRNNNRIMSLSLGILFVVYWMVEYSYEYLSGHYFVPNKMYWIDTIMWTIPTIVFLPLWATLECILYVNNKLLANHLLNPNNTTGSHFTYQSFRTQLYELSSVVGVTATASLSYHHQQQQQQRTMNWGMQSSSTMIGQPNQQYHQPNYPRNSSMSASSSAVSNTPVSVNATVPMQHQQHLQQPQYINNNNNNNNNTGMLSSTTFTNDMPTTTTNDESSDLLL